MEIYFANNFDWNQRTKKKIPESGNEIVGLSGAKVEVREHLDGINSKLAIFEQTETNGKLRLKHFPSGSVIVIKLVWLLIN